MNDCILVHLLFMHSAALQRGSPELDNDRFGSYKLMIAQQTYPSSYLRQSLSKIALGIRRSRIEIGTLDQPFSFIDYEFYDGGRTYKRKKIILAARGCTAATCTMCPIPNEAYYGLNLNFTPEDFLRQFHAAFATAPIDSYQLISV